MSRSRLRVGDAVVDRVGELGEVHEVDAEHQDEVVGDDAFFEVGPGLADLEELVQAGVVLGHRSSSGGSRSTRRQ